MAAAFLPDPVPPKTAAGGKEVRVAGSTKVLYAASTFGHLRSFHLPYLRALRDAGCEVVALAGGDPSGLPDGVRCVVEPFTKSFTSPYNLRAAVDVARLQRRERFGAVFVHTSLAAFFVRLGVAAGGKGATRVVNTVHGYLFDDASPAPRRAALLGAERLVAGVTDLVVTMNDQDAAVARRFRLGREPVALIDGMGVDLAGLRPASARDRQEARRELGLADDAFVLLYAAEFSDRKNQRMLVEALAGLPERAVLALPGRGDRFDACRARAEELGVAGRVRMPGFVRDLGTWRAAADVCVSASRFEGLPFHVIEGMACGLPAVLSDVKGHEDLVGDGTACGMRYPFGDAASFCACVERLMGDADLRERMGKAACARAQRYDLRLVMPQVMGLYREAR